MEPFWSGVAIGLAVSMVLFIIAAAVIAIIFVFNLIAAFCVGVWYFGHCLARQRRAHLEQIAEQRRAMGLPPIPSFREANRIGMIRMRRILRHPIRERALIAECFRALRNPLLHRWSDGLS